MANRRFIDFPIATTVGDSDIILIWQSGVNKQTTKATFLSGLPENLDELNDVAISGLTNGQILRYDSVTGKWENTDQGNLDLNDLNDVSIVSPSNGQVLVYNSSTSKWENSSGGFVPYVGAVTTVDLGAQGLRAGYVRFDTSVASVPNEQGLMYWDASRSTAALIMNGTLQHIGQDTFFYVKNSSGSNIPKGTCVRFAGTDGASGHLLVAPFLANGSVPSSYFMGVTAEAITNGSFGQVMHFGELEGINTSGFTAGALLYASTTVAGGFQTTVPVAPNNIVLVAAAVNSKNNGAIVVRPTLGSNINSDEGVKITSPTTGDLLQLQAGGLWENKTIDGAGIVTKATSQVISGLKTFNVNTLMMQSSGNANAVYLSNSSGSSTYQSGFNFFGFNTDNHIYFAKSSITGGNTGILAWSNTATRTYTLKDASGTLAFTSDIPANPVGGTGTTNYLPKFTGTSTIGNSIVFESGNSIGIGTIVPQNYTNYSVLEINNTTGGAIRVKNTASTGLFELATNSSETYIKNVSNTPMWFGTNNTQMLTLTTSGNLGLGVTPSAWGSNFKALQLSSVASLSGYQGNFTLLGTNFYYDVSETPRYLTNAAAMLYRQGVDSHIWFNAPSGTAGNAISFTQAMTLTSGGNLLVGTTTDNGARLQVSGGGWFEASTPILSIRGTGSGEFGLRILDGSATVAGLTYSSITGEQRLNGQQSYVFQTIYAGGSERLRVTTSGNLLVGTTTDNGARLQVSGRINATGGGSNGVLVSSNSGSVTIPTTGLSLNTGFNVGYLQNFNGGNYVDLYYGASKHIFDGGNVGIGTSSPSGRLTVSSDQSSNNQHINILGTQSGFSQEYTIGIPTSTKDLRIYDLTANVERMRITSGGNVLIGTTSDNGARLQVSGSGAAVSILNASDIWYNVTRGSSFTNIGVDSTGSFYNTNTNHRFLTNSGSTTAVTITSSGNVGIGTSSPSFQFTVGQTGSSANSYIQIANSTSGTGSIYFGDTAGFVAGAYSGFIEYSHSSDFMIFGTTSTERMRITSGGNVGIGTASPQGRLHLYENGAGVYTILRINNDNSTANFHIGVGGSGVANGGLQNNAFLWNVGNSPMVFGTNDTERMRITSGGEVLIGNTDNGAYNLQCNGTGVWGAGAYVNGSDRNIKDNIATIEKGLEYIQKMNPVKFRYKPNYTRDHSMQTGFIAQELQEVFASEDYLSGLVQQGVHLSVAYQNLLPVLVKAIQELKQEIDTLKN